MVIDQQGGSAPACNFGSVQVGCPNYSWEPELHLLAGSFDGKGVATAAFVINRMEQMHRASSRTTSAQVAIGDSIPAACPGVLPPNSICSVNKLRVITHPARRRRTITSVNVPLRTGRRRHWYSLKTLGSSKSRREMVRVDLRCAQPTLSPTHSVSSRGDRAYKTLSTRQ